jgi:hypothetical protein
MSQEMRMSYLAQVEMYYERIKLITMKKAAVEIGVTERQVQ